MADDVETIERAAIRHDMSFYSVPRPKRHAEVVRLMAAGGYGPEKMHDQGFLTSRSRFVDRKEALQIALAAGQITAPKFQPNQLFSEDVW
jgi:hypothetical protein